MGNLCAKSVRVVHKVDDDDDDLEELEDALHALKEETKRLEKKRLEKKKRRGDVISDLRQTSESPNTRKVGFGSNTEEYDDHDLEEALNALREETKKLEKKNGGGGNISALGKNSESPKTKKVRFGSILEEVRIIDHPAVAEDKNLRAILQANVRKVVVARRVGVANVAVANAVKKKEKRQKLSKNKSFVDGQFVQKVPAKVEEEEEEEEGGRVTDTTTPKGKSYWGTLLHLKIMISTL